MRTPLLLVCCLVLLPLGAKAQIPSKQPSSPNIIRRQFRSSQKATRFRALREYLNHIDFYQYNSQFLAPYALLEDPDAHLRASTLAVTQQMDRRHTTVVLRHCLASRYPEAQVFAVEHFSDVAPWTPADKARLRTLRQSPHSGVRAAVVRHALLRISDQTLPPREIVLPLLQDPQAMVRRQAARTLLQLNSQDKAVPLSLVLEGAKSPSITERFDTAETLGKLLDGKEEADSAIVQAVIPLTQDPFPLLRLTAVSALAKPSVYNAATARAMAARLNDPNSEIRCTASGYLRQYPENAAFAFTGLLTLASRPITPQSFDSLDDANTLFDRNALLARANAFALLGFIGADSPQIHKKLTGLIKETTNDQFDGTDAFDALSAMTKKQPGLIKPLLSKLALVGPEDDVYWRESARGEKLATLLLLHKDNADSFTILTRFLASQPTGVRRSTVSNLSREWFVSGYRIAPTVLGPSGETSVPTPAKTTYAFDWLKTLLQDKDPKVRQYTAEVISEAAVRDTRVLDLLLPLRNDPDVAVRDKVTSFFDQAFTYIVLQTRGAADAERKELLAAQEAFVTKLEALPTGETEKAKGLPEFIAGLRNLITADVEADIRRHFEHAISEQQETTAAKP